jgi:2,3-bisphosphoglycerate-dependent phosphoglycerate mutase
MAVITRLILARHGEAQCNVAGLVGGDNTCTGLTDLGRRQVQFLSERLQAEHESGARIDVLYAAPRLRVRESAQILSSVLSLPVHIEPGLSGPRHGDADGQPWTEVKTAFGGPPQSDPDRPYARGSETWNQYLGRTGAALAELFGKHSGQRILIVGHGETIEAAATLLLGLPSGTCARTGFQIGHASLTRWNLQRNRFGQEVWMLSALNDTAAPAANTGPCLAQRRKPWSSPRRSLALAPS